MLTITEGAVTRLTSILDREECPEDVAVRLMYEGRRIAMTLDGERQGDTAFKHQGRTVLRLDERVSRRLENRTLDVKHTDDGARLTLRRGRAAP
jgi:Fe-S cluster assembly iron-binding protein IscA